MTRPLPNQFDCANDLGDHENLDLTEDFSPFISRQPARKVNRYSNATRNEMLVMMMMMMMTIVIIIVMMMMMMMMMMIMMIMIMMITITISALS